MITLRAILALSALATTLTTAAAAPIPPATIAPASDLELACEHWDASGYGLPTSIRQDDLYRLCHGYYRDRHGMTTAQYVEAFQDMRPASLGEEDEAIAELPAGLLASLERAGLKVRTYGDWPWTLNGGIVWDEGDTVCGYETWGNVGHFCGDY